MYKLLDTPRVGQRARYVLFGMHYICRALVGNTERMMNRMRNSAYYADNQHILVRILQHLNVRFDGNLAAYRSDIERRIPYISGTLGIATRQHRGHPKYPGDFYGKVAMETYVGVDTDFDIIAMEEDWEDFSPVRVITHPMTSLLAEPLDGSLESTARGMAVLEINIPMLACQYQMWLESQVVGDEDDRRSVHNFVATVPVVNVVWSHLDVSLFNRIDKTMREQDLEDNPRRLPWFTVPVDDHTDRLIQKYLSLIMRTNFDENDILSNTPAIFGENGHVTSMGPDIGISTQSEWVHTLAALPYVAFVLRINQDKSIGRRLVTRTRRWLTQSSSNRNLVNGLAPVVRDYIADQLEDRVRPML